MAKIQSIPSRVVYYLTGFFGNGVFNVYTPYIREIINRLKFKFLSGNGETRLRNEILENLDKREREKKGKEKLTGKCRVLIPSSVSFNPSGLFFRLFRAFPSILAILPSSTPDTRHREIIRSFPSSKRLP